MCNLYNGGWVYLLASLRPLLLVEVWDVSSCATSYCFESTNATCIRTVVMHDASVGQINVLLSYDFIRDFL